MNQLDINYYKAIGKLQVIISNARTLEEALRDGLNLIVKVCNADYAVIWYAEKKNDCVLFPYFWVCPLDFSNKLHKMNEGVVGRVYASQKSEAYLNYNIESKDSCADSDFDDIDISSMICVPLSSKNDNLGCIQFAKQKGSDKFTQDDFDLCEIFTTLIAIYLDENTSLFKPFQRDQVLIEVKDLKKQYKSGDTITNALQGVNLRIYKGEFLVILGESGCGKSTLLNIIGGLDKASSGDFYFEGKLMNNANQNELTLYRRENIGFIFQNYNLMPNLNAKQNLDLIGELVENPLDSGELLKRIGLGDKARNYPSELSGGQQQRLSIARSLIKKPKIIMADEPTAALDYASSIVVLNEMSKITENGTTLIMVTHNEQIAKMADRIVRIRNGKAYETTINRHPLKAKELVW